MTERSASGCSCDVTECKATACLCWCHVIRARQIASLEQFCWTDLSNRELEKIARLLVRLGHADIGAFHPRQSQFTPRERVFVDFSGDQLLAIYANLRAAEKNRRPTLQEVQDSIRRIAWLGMYE